MALSLSAQTIKQAYDSDLGLPIVLRTIVEELAGVWYNPTIDPFDILQLANELERWEASRSILE